MFNKENVNKYKIKIIELYICVCVCVCVCVHSPATLLGTHVQLLGNTNCYTANHMAATQCI